MAIFNKTKFGETRKLKLYRSLWESPVHDIPIFKIELAGNPNSCIVKLNKQKFRPLLNSLICTEVYKSLKNITKLKKQTALLQSVKADSFDVDGCALIEYEIRKEIQEHEFFIVPQKNRNIILG